MEHDGKKIICAMCDSENVIIHGFNDVINGVPVASLMEYQCQHCESVWIDSSLHSDNLKQCEKAGCYTKQ